MMLRILSRFSFVIALKDVLETKQCGVAILILLRFTQVCELPICSALYISVLLIFISFYLFSYTVNTSEYCIAHVHIPTLYWCKKNVFMSVKIYVCVSAASEHRDDGPSTETNAELIIGLGDQLNFEFGFPWSWNQDNRNKTIILSHALSCVINAANPSISTCALCSAPLPPKHFCFQPRQCVLPVRVLKKLLEEDGRRWQKCSLWSGRKVKWILWCFKEPDSEQAKILCKICHATVSATQGNTTNLFKRIPEFKVQ